MLLISWTSIALQLESWFILKQYFTLYNPVKSERTHITAGKIKLASIIKMIDNPLQILMILQILRS